MKLVATIIMATIGLFILNEFIKTIINNNE